MDLLVYVGEIQLIYDKYPIEFWDFDRKVVNDKEEFLEKINRNNRFINIFSSVYAFRERYNDKVEYDSAIIDKIYFDLDPDEYDNDYNKMMSDVIKFDNQYKEYKRIIAFSGRGFHLYIAHEDSNHIQYKSDYIKNYQYFLNKDLNMPVDSSCIGRKEKLMRIINSRNNKTKLYCISLESEDLLKGINYIRELAKKPRKIKILGKKTLNFIKEFDIQDTTYVNIPNFDFKTQDIQFDEKYMSMNALGIEIEGIPPCIQYLININDHSYDERRFLILYFKYCGLSLENTRSLLKLILNPSKYYHVTGEKIGKIDRKYLGRVENQDISLYKKDYYISCNKIKSIGLCSDKCNFKDVLHNLV